MLQLNHVVTWDFKIKELRVYLSILMLKAVLDTLIEFMFISVKLTCCVQHQMYARIDLKQLFNLTGTMFTPVKK